MKILRLQLLNLNSLQGSNEVDFTKSPLANSGLFAITGPTGAGKSTILDAITLALYGRAARYGSTSNPRM
jgi:DNA repair protein SbcC/Rad50